MKKIVLLLAACSLGYTSYGQSYSDTIIKHRQAYKREFIEEERSPLKKDDTAFLRFYTPDAQYRVNARVILTPDAEPFQMATYSGKTQQYKKYADLYFKIHGKPHTLEVYQSIALMKNPKYSDHLFVPFKDLTNGDETYGGGRYIDMVLGDLNNGSVLLDFNKCYNPYCAYSDGYNCPIPPAANRLETAIKAGEMNYGKPGHH